MTATPSPVEPPRRRATDRMPVVQVSVLVPVLERPAALDALYREFSAPLRAAGIDAEFVFVLEPRYAGLAEALRPLQAAGEPVRPLLMAQEVDPASLVAAGLREARGNLIVLLPAYPRVVADALPDLVRQVASGTDLVAARRWPRRDPWLNRLQHRTFHALLGKLAADRLHDLGCGVVAMRREVLEQVSPYGDLLRFLPVLAMREAYRVDEADAQQHPADLDRRVYGAGVYVRRLLDLLGLYFLVRFTEKPLRFFGALGAVFLAAGGLILLVLFLQKLQGVGIANRPLLLLGLLLFVVGVQIVALGLVAEVIVFLQAPTRRSYRLASEREAGQPHA